MDFLYEFSEFETWYTITSLTEMFTNKTRHEWQWVEYDGIDEDAPKERFRELVEIDESPEGREYQKLYLVYYRAIKTLEKKGLIKVRQATESELEALQKEYDEGKLLVSLNRREI